MQYKTQNVLINQDEYLHSIDDNYWILIYSGSGPKINRKKDVRAEMGDE